MNQNDVGVQEQRKPWTEERLTRLENAFFNTGVESPLAIDCREAAQTIRELLAASHPPVAQGLEEIASRIYLEKFTRKDDPDVIGAAVVSYGIDVLTNYVRQSAAKSAWPTGDEIREIQPTPKHKRS